MATLNEALQPLTEKVTVRGWVFTVRELDYAASTLELIAGDDAELKLIAACVFDDAGNPVFTDLAAMRKLPVNVIRKLGDAVSRINGFNAEANEKK